MVEANWTDERADILTQIALLQADMSAVKTATAGILTMQADIAQLRATLTQVLGQLQSQTASTTGQMTTMQLDCVRRGEQAAQVAVKVTAHEARLDALEKALNGIQPWVRAATFIAGIVGAAIIALIWSMITGQAQIVLH